MKSCELFPTPDNLYQSFTSNTIGRRVDVWAFCEMLNSIESAYCVSIDGSWGSGKTFFVKQVKMVLDALNVNIKNEELTEEQIQTVRESCNNLSQGHLEEMQPQVCVYYDAWKNDNDADPILSIVYSILCEMKTDFHFSGDSKMAEKVAALVGYFTNTNLKEFFEACRSNTIFDSLKSEKTLEKEISDFLESLLYEKGNRLVIFVDELDRCRPTYAVRVLERIKHYFGNDRITFVFSINAKELECTIGNAYGVGFDSGRYLDRFFDLRIPLPEPNMNAYFSSIGFIKDSWGYQNFCHAFIKTYNLQMREIGRYADATRRAEDYKMSYDPRDRGANYAKMIFLPIMIGLKQINASLYEAFTSGNNPSPLIDVAQNVPEDSFDLLLNAHENYQEVGKENSSQVVVSLDERLKEYYKLVFAESWTSGYRSIGKIDVGANTAVALKYAASGLTSLWKD